MMTVMIWLVCSLIEDLIVTRIPYKTARHYYATVSGVMIMMLAEIACVYCAGRCLCIKLINEKAILTIEGHIHFGIILEFDFRKIGELDK